MKILYNKNDEIEALMGFEPMHNVKIIHFLLVMTLPTELFILITNSAFKTTPDF